MSERAESSNQADATELRLAVRKRPGMYVGSTGRSGRVHLLFEVLANAVDLVLAGKASAIDVTVHDDGSFSVRDDGPGLDLSEEAVRGWFVDPHNSATVDDHHPHIHLAFPGNGLAIVTSLASRLDVESTRQGFTRRLTWFEGGANKSALTTEASPAQTGTSIRVWPDASIFEPGDISRSDVADRIRDLNALIPQMQLRLSEQSEVATWQDGLAQLLADLSAQTPADSVNTEPFYFRGQVKDSGNESVPMELSVAIAGSTGDSERMGLWCNYFPVNETSSGLHKAVRTAVWRACALRTKTPGPENPEDEPLRGMTIVASLTMLDPVFGGPTRRRVDDPRATRAVTAVLDEHLSHEQAERVLAGPMHHCELLASS